jgi:ribosomal protein L37E
MIRGIELKALGKSRAIDIRYEGGDYFGPNGQVLDTLMDMSCYNCGNAYYTLEEDPIEFCPHCGFFERRKFDNYEDLRVWAREQTWNFVKSIAEIYVAVQLDDRWEVRPTSNPEVLKRSDRYEDVRPLMDDLLT